jgi:hypothetical protein
MTTPSTVRHRFTSGDEPFQRVIILIGHSPLQPIFRAFSVIRGVEENEIELVRDRREQVTLNGMGIREPVSVEIEPDVARRVRRYVRGNDEPGSAGGRKDRDNPASGPDLEKALVFERGKAVHANFPDQSYFGLNTPGKILMVFPRYEMS